MNDRQRILVVDDDRDMQRLLNRTLELEGFDTIIADDGESALNLLGEMQPDLVILETVRPEHDSFQILDHMRKHSNVPIIILTTDYEVESLRKALYHGADDYIRKPFGTRSLVARIRAKLRRTQMIKS
jgi:two-component system response regulator VicR